MESGPASEYRVAVAVPIVVGMPELLWFSAAILNELAPIIGSKLPLLSGAPHVMASFTLRVGLLVAKPTLFRR